MCVRQNIAFLLLWPLFLYKPLIFTYWCWRYNDTVKNRRGKTGWTKQYTIIKGHHINQLESLGQNRARHRLLVRFLSRFWTFTPAHADKKKEKTHIQTATLDHHNYKCFFFIEHKKKKCFSYAVNYCDTSVFSHCCKCPTHISIIFFFFKTSNLTSMFNFLAPFQVQIWLNKTKPVTRCLQSGKTNKKKIRQSTDS